MSALEEKLRLEERDQTLERIAARLGVRAERGRRFAELTSLRVGGAIDWVISPETEEQAAAIVYELEKAGIGWRPLGSGSNVLADDKDHHYVVLSLSEMKGEVHIDGDLVSVSAGYSLPRLCIDVARRGLSGIEGLGGIPGTVGGALWMNAGAYGHEIGTVTETVRVARGGRVEQIPGSSVRWNYRHTSFKEGELLVGATLRLTPDDPARIKERMDDAKSRRLASQPHGSRSAGCFFKNPPTGTTGTGKIIDELGMKGERRGSAIVSPVHANFIVTEGEGARAEDAMALAEEIRERVKREHGIDLEYEVELWRSNTPDDKDTPEKEEQQ
jgi:UDP-N-acetylmuramate dehydrogenase